jgi:sec-independent protein translocase protein TatA
MDGIILAMWTPGPIELTVILIITVLVFGKRLPEIARSVGRSLGEFKKGMKDFHDVKDEIEDDVKDSSED